MYIGRSFPSLESNSQRILGYDLSVVLQPGEIPELALSTLICTYGSDMALALDPTARFAGTAQISGPQVTQGIIVDDPTEALVGNQYSLLIAVTTSLVQTFIPWAYFSVEQGAPPPQAFPGAPSAASAQIIVLPTPGPNYTVPALSGFADHDWPTAVPGEQLLYGLDFSAALSPGETVGAAYASLSLLTGVDPVIQANPTAYSVGSPVVSGPAVQQMLAWPTSPPSLAGNAYRLDILAQTSFNQSISAWSRIAIGVI